MRKGLILSVSVVMLLMLARLSDASARAAGARYDQLVKTEAAWDAANLHRDIAGLKRVLAPDFVQINEDGSVVYRDEALEKMAGSKSHATASKVEKRVIKIHGDTAVITAIYTEVGKSPKGYYRVVLRIADIYRYAKGEWKGSVGYGHVIELKSGQAKALAL
ncbi:MAG: nuclear transport factor 2 family protein [Candidatus Acidiferrales bacterium]